MGAGLVLWRGGLECLLLISSLSTLRRVSSRTPYVSLEGTRSLAFVVPKASQGPSVLHRGEGEDCTASGTQTEVH